MLEGCECTLGEELGSGLNYGRGTGPGYYHAPVAKPTFAKTLPVRFTPNETVMMAESRDMFYGLDGLGLTELSSEPYGSEGGLMLERIDPMPPTGVRTIFARADNDLVGPGVRWGTRAATLHGLGAVIGPQSRWSAPRGVQLQRPTFAPRQRLAPMVSPASLARAQKLQGARRALLRRQTAQLKAAHQATRTTARWR